MAKNVLIVESPAKAKTIEKYLGKDFIVKSSYGHIRDLDKGNKGIDIEDNFRPNYVISPEKQKVVAELKKIVKTVDSVWLATDEDREGEAISWHLCEVLGLDIENTRRIVFREITKPAIQKAITNPRSVDLNLVKAQQARRILDRLVGFELSELLWRKIKGRLSAGRVQSVAVKIIVEREREISSFLSNLFFKLLAQFNVDSENGQIVVMDAELVRKLDDESEANSFLVDCQGAEFKVADIKIRPTKRKPPPPFITSTLQQEASRKLGYSVSRTMQNAQRLYEQGHITYMRTDSVSMSELALTGIKEFVSSEYGDKYVQTRRYKSKNASAQEAHEAIRPTYFDKKEAGKDSDQAKLYSLIWKRAFASQMADAELEKTVVDISISTRSEDKLKAEGEVMKFDGFLRIYNSHQSDNGDELKGILPPLTKGQPLKLKNMTATERFTRPPARYTEATLVKKLEELGIGRPSTYAPTITKITEKARGYVTKESRDGIERKFTIIQLENGEIKSLSTSEITGATKNRLYGSDMGMIVIDFLEEHFSEIMDYNFTASIENKFDVISKGSLEWNQMIKEFYDPFHETVENTKEHADRASGERILGKDTDSNRTLLVRMSRFGPVAQIGAPEELGEEEKPRYANLRTGQSLETITAEEAIDLFQLPKTLGEYHGQEVIINVGRFGPYVKFGESFISIPRGEDPLEVSKERAIEIIEIKKKEDEPIGNYEEKPISKGKGRFGPFLKWDGMFVNIPRRFDPELITLDESHELIKAKVEKEANRYIHRWPDEGISVENGRWGPLVKIGKARINIKIKDKRISPEEATDLTFEDIIKIIETHDPTLLKKKKKKKSKK